MSNRKSGAAGPLVDVFGEDVSARQLIDNFDVVIEATGGTRRLREMILDLAISGRLGHGRHAPGPRRNDAKPPTVVGEPLASIPEGWVRTRIGDAFEVVGGIQKTPARTPKLHHSPYLRVENVQRGKLNLDRLERFELQTGELERWRLESGDLLIVEGNGSESEIGRCALWDGAIENCVHQNHIIRCRSRGGTLPEFALLFLNSPTGMAEMKALAITTSGLFSLSVGKIRGISLVTPPPDEQRRIVARVHELLALCDDLEARQWKKRELAARFTTSAITAVSAAAGAEGARAAWGTAAQNLHLLSHAAGGPRLLRDMILDLAVIGRLGCDPPTSKARQVDATASGSLDNRSPVYPAGWVQTKIGEAFDVVGGIQKTPARAPQLHHFPYLRVENVQRGKLNLDRMERFELQDAELERWRLQAGDLLIVEGNGSETEIGRCALWNGEVPDCVHQNHIIRCRSRGGVLPEFALLFLNSPTGMAQMKALAITTSGLFSLSVGKIRGIALPMPPLSEQKRIVAEVARLLVLCEDFEARLRVAEDRAARFAEAVVRELVA